MVDGNKALVDNTKKVREVENEKQRVKEQKGRD